GQPHRPDSDGFPAGGEPQDADARGWPAALREARRRGPSLRPRDGRADASRRGGLAALPQAPAPLGPYGGAAGVAARRGLRHRAPRAPQRTAEARPDPGAPRAVLPPARHPAGVGAAAVGVDAHRGAPRRSGRDVHQGPPLAHGRRLGDAPAPERPVDRPGRARDGGTVGGPAGSGPTAAARGADLGGGGDGAGDAHGARHHRRGGRDAGRSGQDAQPERAQRDLAPLALRTTDAVQPEDHRLPPVRRPGLADRADACRREGHRDHHQRRGARDVRRCDAHLPARARRPPGDDAGLDGAGGPQRQAVPPRLARRRQRGRRGDGPARHPPPRPRRPARRDPPVDEGRQGGARVDDAGADHGDERAGPGPGDPRPHAADAGRRAAAVQPHHQQRARPEDDALLERRPSRRHLPAVHPDQRDGAQHHLHVVRRQDGVRAHRLPPHRPPPPADAHPPRRRAGCAGEVRGGL
ncbi:MAG: Wax ester synthase/acyl-CoA:diacylglycerol acyltransferase, partial [uncultured Nocardioides sp.]